MGKSQLERLRKKFRSRCLFARIDCKSVKCSSRAADSRAPRATAGIQTGWTAASEPFFTRRLSRPVWRFHAPLHAPARKDSSLDRHRTWKAPSFSLTALPSAARPHSSFTSAMTGGRSQNRSPMWIVLEPFPHSTSGFHRKTLRRTRL